MRYCTRCGKAHEKGAECILTVLGGYELDMRNHGELLRQSMPVYVGSDYGADPMGDGTHRMVPSGEIVSYEERCRRLTRKA